MRKKSMKLSMNERRCRKIKRRSIYSLKKPSIQQRQQKLQPAKT